MSYLTNFRASISFPTGYSKSLDMEEGVAVTRPRRLFAKNTGLCKAVRPCMTPSQCQKVKEVGDLIIGEPATEAPRNSDHNYNDLKVAKFLIGYLPICFPRHKSWVTLHIVRIFNQWAVYKRICNVRAYELICYQKKRAPQIPVSGSTGISSQI